jgi:hypothetical protein
MKAWGSNGICFHGRGLLWPIHPPEGGRQRPSGKPAADDGRLPANSPKHGLTWRYPAQ